jgi:hypothetical protein
MKTEPKTLTPEEVREHLRDRNASLRGGFCRVVSRRLP